MYKLPPVYPGRLPIVGHSLLLLGKNEEEVWEYYKSASDFSLRHDGVASVDIGHKRIYFVTDPADCLTVSNICLSKPYMYQFAEPWLKAGLLLAEPLQWKLGRNMYMSLMNPRKFSMELLNKHSIQLVNKLSQHLEKGKHRLSLIFNMYALESILGFMFGEESEDMTAENLEYYATSDEVAKMVITRAMNPLLYVPFIYKRVALGKKILHLTETATKGMQKRIESRKRLQNLSQDNNIEDDFAPILDKLLDINDKEKQYTDGELTDHVETIIVTAFDTTARALELTLLCIGSYAHVQEKIYAELEEVLAGSDRDLMKGDLSKLVYLEATIKESLRVYPVVPLIGRIASEDIKLRNYTIPKGGLYLLSIHGMHRHSVWGPDAEEFRPERWLHTNGVPENAYAAFSLGKRSCVGKAYGIASMKMALAHVLRRYKVKADLTKVVFEANVFLTPKSGAEVELALRKP